MTTPIDDGGPAFPCEGGPDGMLIPGYGMTLRDYFAAKAMIGLAPLFMEVWTHSGRTAPWPSNLGIQIDGAMDSVGKEPDEFFADAAYVIADAMLRARKNGESS